MSDPGSLSTLVGIAHRTDDVDGCSTLGCAEHHQLIGSSFGQYGSSPGTFYKVEGLCTEKLGGVSFRHEKDGNRMGSVETFGPLDDTKRLDCQRHCDTTTVFRNL